MTHRFRERASKCGKLSYGHVARNRNNHHDFATLGLKERGEIVGKGLTSFEGSAQEAQNAAPSRCFQYPSKCAPRLE